MIFLKWVRWRGLPTLPRRASSPSSFKLHPWLCSGSGVSCLPLLSVLWRNWQVTLWWRQEVVKAWPVQLGSFGDKAWFFWDRMSCSQGRFQTSWGAKVDLEHPSTLSPCLSEHSSLTPQSTIPKLIACTSKGKEAFLYRADFYFTASKDAVLSSIKENMRDW